MTTTWNILFAMGMLVSAFGWSGGRGLVEQSYRKAKQKAADQKAARAAKKAAGRNAEPAQPRS